MAPHKLIKVIGMITLLGFSSVSWGLTISNPAPALLGDDIDGNGLFIPGDLIFNVEITDTLGSLGLSGSEFGFYYASSPAILTPIFQATDQSPGTQSASVNFNNGVVRDLDQGAIQNLFIPQGPANIGFYLQITSVLGKTAFDHDIIFTEATRNGGENLAAEFPTLSPLDAFLISFADININNGNQITLGSYFVTPLSAVPIPAAVWLFATALIGMFGFSKRKARI